MPFDTSNLRRAAVLIRSVDAETAARLLAQLSADEAAAVREAVRALGTIDPDEQVDVADRLRRAGPPAEVSPATGVELELSRSAETSESGPPPEAVSAATRFEFLEQATTKSLAPYLAREHAQTIAVVLAHLPPARAAAVLASLPPKVQAGTIQRLATLGDTDPESISAVERELAAWVARQPATRRDAARYGETIQGILAAADSSTRTQILANLERHNQQLAARVAPQPAAARVCPESVGDCPHFAPWGVQCDQKNSKMGTVPLSQTLSGQTLRHRSQAGNHEPLPNRAPAQQPRREPAAAARESAEPPRATSPQSPPPPSSPAMHFDDLTRMDAADIVALLRIVDANVLVLALAGASDALVKHVTRTMPRPVANALRRQLRQLGPTRLSDVEAAQRAVARAAAQRVANGASPRLAAAG